MTTELSKAQVIELRALNSFGEGGTVWPSKEAAKFDKLGVVELGNAVDGDQTQIRISAAGVQYLNELDAGSQSADNGDQSGDNAQQKKTTGGSQMQFAIQNNIEIPKATRRSRTSAYPFDALEIGQSFFVPATAERPEPAKTMGSTVSAANERHSEETGETKLNRKGREVPVLRPLRTFIVRAVEDGAPWGQPGVAGAGVWRTEVATEVETADDAE